MKIDDSMDETTRIDPVCLTHGKRKSSHWCVQCSVCFKDLDIDDCHIGKQGFMENLCHECAANEQGSLVVIRDLP